jgi:hypothetical protein
MSSRSGESWDGKPTPRRGLLILMLFGSVVVAATALLGGCHSQNAARGAAPTSQSTFSAVTGSGNLITRQVDARDFTEVEVEGAFKVDITQNDAFSVTVTADDNVVDLVNVEKQGQTLRIGLKSGSYHSATYRANVGMPDLRRLHISGASSCTFTGLKPRTLDVGLSGASHLTGRVQAGQIKLVASEASTAILGGSADDLTVTASGASQASLGDLSARTARASLVEASSGTVNVTDKLDVELRSASNLYYVGNPSLGSVSAVEGSTLRHR